MLTIGILFLLPGYDALSIRQIILCRLSGKGKKPADVIKERVYQNPTFLGRPISCFAVKMEMHYGRVDGL
jgi:hypothetical protein